MSTDPSYPPPPEPNYGGYPPESPYGATPPQPGGYAVPDRSEAASKKLAAGITGILLGSLGVHKFILGYTNAGIIMLVVTLACSVIGSCLIFPIVGAMAMWVIGIVEGIIYLTKSDEEFYQMYMVGKKEWF